MKWRGERDKWRKVMSRKEKTILIKCSLVQRRWKKWSEEGGRDHVERAYVWKPLKIQHDTVQFIRLNTIICYLELERMHLLFSKVLTMRLNYHLLLSHSHTTTSKIFDYKLAYLSCLFFLIICFFIYHCSIILFIIKIIHLS